MADVARAALTERSGSSTKGRTNIRYFVAKLSIVAIYALFERLSSSFNENQSAFGELLESFQKKPVFSVIMKYGTPQTNQSGPMQCMINPITASAH